jgi:hypothetical protein
MNLDNRPSIDQLRELVKQCNDDAGDHVLWVSRTGDVRISRASRDQTSAEFDRAHPDMQLRFEAFLAGNEYVGPEAAADNEWIAELFERLGREWNNAKGKPVVARMDRF